MNRLNHRRLRAGLLAGLTALGVALFGVGLWSGKTARAAGPAMVGDVLNYASPVEMLFSPDGARLYVLCQQSGEVRVLDAATYSPIKKIAVGRVPRGLSFSAKGDRLFVANSWDDTVSVIDTQSLDVTATWPVGAEPSSVVEDREGKHLFVANRISNDIAVLDAQTGVEEKRLAGGTRRQLHHAFCRMAAGCMSRTSIRIRRLTAPLPSRRLL